MGGDSEIPSEHLSDHAPVSPASVSPESIENEDFVPQGAISSDVSRIDPSSFHLKPVTEEDLDQIVFPSDEKFDVVDGLLVWDRMEGTKKHQGIAQLHSELFLLDEKFRAAQGKVQAITAEIDKGNEGKRRIDLLLTKRASPTSSEENPSPTQKRMESHAYCSSSKPAHVAIEFTSGNHNTDFYSKWVEYRRTKIPFYYVFDMFERSKTGKSRVIVGSIDHFVGAELSDNGDPQKTASSSSTSQKNKMYYKKVFSERDVLNIGPYASYKLAVKDWMSETLMTGKVAERRKEIAKSENKISHLEKQLAQQKKEVELLKAQLEIKDRTMREQAMKIKRLEEDAKKSTGRKQSGGSSTVNSPPRKRRAGK